jgi:chorismate mutase
MAEELSLESLREEIDRLDEVIVRLLDRRARCAFAIGRIKSAMGRAIYEPEREAVVISRVKALNATLEGPLDEQAIGRLYERIIDEARRIQRIEAKHEPAAADPDDFVERE